MHTRQHTIQKAVSVQGVGLHSGKASKLTFYPAPAGHGIKFQRVDLEGQPTIDADADLVVDVSRSTTLEHSGARVQTIEHCLSAIVGSGLDNVRIEIDGPEVPILDGSAGQYMAALEAAGLEEQNALREYCEFSGEVTHSEPDRGVSISATPSSQYRLDVHVDYQAQTLPPQDAQLHHLQQYKQEIAPSRTFVFFHELEALLNAGLIKGGDVDNAIVIVDRQVSEAELKKMAELFRKPKIEVREEGILNNIDLRYPNEPARHKLLDLVGDLALVGKPLRAHVKAVRPGHAANVALAKKLKAKMKKSSAPLYDPAIEPMKDVNGIMAMLPHRYPFVMIDKVIHLDSGTVAAIKNVTINEGIFTGHFPDNPVFPGVLQVESMVQTGGILVLSTVPDPENYWTYFLAIDKCKFRQKVVPGDTLITKCELDGDIKRGIARMQCYAYVADRLVCEAYMTAQIVRKDA